MILFEKVFYINFALVNSKLIRGGGYLLTLSMTNLKTMKRV